MLILMINMFIAVGSFGIIIPILPAYLLSIGQGGTAAGLMIAIFAGAQLVMSPIAGKWTDRYGRRIMIISGLSGLALSMFVFYFSDSIGVLYLSRVIGGVGAALLIPSDFCLCGRYYDNGSACKRKQFHFRFDVTWDCYWTWNRRILS